MTSRSWGPITLQAGEALELGAGVWGNVAVRNLTDNLRFGATLLGSAVILETGGLTGEQEASPGIDVILDGSRGWLLVATRPVEVEAWLHER